ncbi:MULTISPECIES: hypothetical protein [unclassified Acinetobacter]|uniref:hypothetical protein n=1 Tax=unclassified Acinetobacter TaxID=196816 RepID=UPI0015D324B5|nr:MULTISPECIES: hypothetical protein [unclassified Acinetobacter]MDM1759094.1 hypothetical protein [Acinetobacter sp. 256-1]
MLKVPILGAGRIAQIHSKSALLNTQCELKLIADPWKEGVDKLANLFDGLQALNLAVCAMASVESNKAITVNSRALQELPAENIGLFLS